MHISCWMAIDVKMYNLEGIKAFMFIITSEPLRDMYSSKNNKNRI
jgi:hypothetical protein